MCNCRITDEAGNIRLEGGTLEADGQFAGFPSALFDAVASFLSMEQMQSLCKEAAAVQWFMDAYGHCKLSAHCEGARVLLDKAAWKRVKR